MIREKVVCWGGGNHVAGEREEESACGSLSLAEGEDLVVLRRHTGARHRFQHLSLRQNGNSVNRLVDRMA